VPPDAPARDREAELLAGPIAGAEVEPGPAQPSDRQILEEVPGREDAQLQAGEAVARLLRHVEVLVLQAPRAGVAEP
jgi:hypothetical protein